MNHDDSIRAILRHITDEIITEFIRKILAIKALRRIRINKTPNRHHYSHTPAADPLNKNPTVASLSHLKPAPEAPGTDSPHTAACNPPTPPASNQRGRLGRRWVGVCVGVDAGGG